MKRWTAVGPSWIAAFSLLGLGCSHDPSYRPVSPDAVGAAVRQLDSGADSAKLRDENGVVHTVDRDTTVQLKWSGGAASGNAALGVLARDCREGTGWSARRGPLGQPGCPLTDGKTVFWLMAPEERPDWAQIVGYPLAVAGAGGLISLNVACFASWYNDTGRAVVVSTDVAVVLGVIGLLAFYNAVRNGMR